MIGGDATTVFTVPVPVVSTSEAESLALNAFGVTGTARKLTGERDCNFVISAQAGPRYLLKVVNPAEPPAVTAFQNSVLLHLAAEAPDLAAPRVLRTVDGEEIAHDLHGHPVRMLTFLEGVPLAVAKRTPEQALALARLLATLDRALANAPTEGAPQDLLWDLSLAARLRPLLIHIGESEERGRVEAILDRFEDKVLPVLASLRRQAIHNDFNPSNVLVREDDAEAVAGVIDFGDMVEGPLVNDVGTAASYHAVAEGDALAPLLAFTRAYHSVNPLQPKEAGLVFDLARTRMSMTALITAWRSRLQPENAEYILRNAGRARGGIANAAAVDPDAAAEAFIKITERKS